MTAIIRDHKLKMRVMDLGLDKVHPVGWTHQRALHVDEEGRAFVDPYAPARPHRDIVEAPMMVKVKRDGMGNPTEVTVDITGLSHDWVKRPMSRGGDRWPVTDLKQ